MQLINEFIAGKKVIARENNLSLDELKEVLSLISFAPGAQLLGFLEKYSYLAYSGVEFYGINAKLKEKSSLIKDTKELAGAYKSVKGYCVVEYYGEGYYVLVDSEDNIYNFFEGDSEAPEAVGIKLFDYILKRLIEAETY